MPLKINFRVEDRAGSRRFILAIAGELDAATVARLRERLRRMPVGECVWLDLREMTFVDSTGIGALLREKDGRGDLLRIIGPPPRVAHVFEMAGAGRLLTEQPAG